MWYSIGADIIALAHMTFIVFVVFGAVLGRRNRWWRLSHIGAMIYGVLTEIFYWYCPLTYVEQYLRKRAGTGAYEDPFIAHYLNKIIYIDASQGILIGAALVVLAANGLIYIQAWRKTRPEPSLRGSSLPG
jgi:hypothetical protein